MGEDTQINYRYFEKDNKNIKMTNEAVRRLLTTREDLEATYKGAVIDQYAEKLLHSGYSREQTRKMLKNGIKGYLGRKRNRENRGLKLRSTAWENRKSKCLGKTVG